MVFSLSDWSGCHKRSWRSGTGRCFPTGGCAAVRARQPCICKLDTKRGRGWGANYCLRGKEWEVLYRMTFVEICSAMVSHALIHVQTIVHPLQCCLLPEFRLFLTLCLLWRTMRSTFSQQSFQSEPSTGNKWTRMQLCAMQCIVHRRSIENYANSVEIRVKVPAGGERVQVCSI